MNQIALPTSPALPADPPVDAYLDALLGRSPAVAPPAETTATDADAPEPILAGAPDPAPAADGEAASAPPAGAALSPDVDSAAGPATDDNANNANANANAEAEAEAVAEAETVTEAEAVAEADADASDHAPAQAEAALPTAPARAPLQEAPPAYSPPLAVPSVRAAPPPIGQRWLRVAIGDDRYAVELLRVQEVVRLAPIIAVRGAPPSLLGVMNLRGRVVPVYDLGRWLRRQPAQIDDRTRIVVLEHHDELAGLLVSAVTDVVTLDANQIEPPAASLRDRTSMGIARTPGAPPTVLLDATAVFD